MEMTKVREAVARLDDVFCKAFEANHPAAKDYAQIRFVIQSVLEAKMPEKRVCIKHRHYDNLCRTCEDSNLFNSAIDACTPLVGARDGEIKRLQGLEALHEVARQTNLGRIEARDNEIDMLKSEGEKLANRIVLLEGLLVRIAQDVANVWSEEARQAIGGG